MLQKLLAWYFENKQTNVLANWHNCSTGQGYETVNFAGQEVKVMGGCSYIWRPGGDTVFGRIWSSAVGL